MRSFALNHPQWKDHKLNFELWSTGSISKESFALIKQASKNTIKYSIEYRDTKWIKEYAKNFKDKNLIQLLDEHY